MKLHFRGKLEMEMFIRDKNFEVTETVQYTMSAITSRPYSMQLLLILSAGFLHLKMRTYSRMCPFLISKTGPSGLEELHCTGLWQ